MTNAAAMKSASGAMRSLVAMEANKRSLRKLLELTIQPDLPPHLMRLLQDLDTAETPEGRGSTERKPTLGRRSPDGWVVP
jgi:hypothetical protein